MRLVPHEYDVALDDLLEASAGARAAASAAIARSQRLLGAAQEACSLSRARRFQSRAHLRYVVVRGLVEGQPVSAIVRARGQLMADPALLDRARLLVSLGETFDHGRIAATLTDSHLAVALTLIRACDRVLAIEVGPAAAPAS
jgi:hypothetical protein